MAKNMADVCTQRIVETGVWQEQYGPDCTLGPFDDTTKKAVERMKTEVYSALKMRCKNKAY